MRHCSFWLVLCVSLLLGLVGTNPSNAQSDDTATVIIEADPSLMELLKTWDPDIWFFTPSDNPLQSLEGLTSKDIACWGMEHFSRVQEMFKVLGIENEGVSVIGDGAYNDEADKPRLYITWAKYAGNLKGAVRVEFVEKKAAQEG